MQFDVTDFFVAIGKDYQETLRLERAPFVEKDVGFAPRKITFYQIVRSYSPPWIGLLCSPGNPADGSGTSNLVR